MPDLPTDPRQLALLAADPNPRDVHAAIHRHARTRIDAAHPEHAQILQTANAADRHARTLQRTCYQQIRALDERLMRHGHQVLARDPEALLAAAEAQVTDLTSKHEKVEAVVAGLLRDPAIRSLPPERLNTERDSWRHDRQAAQATREAAQRAEQAAALARARENHPLYHPTPDHPPRLGHGIGHSGLTPPQHGHGIGR